MERMSLEEACAAVADVYEGNPDAWCRGTFAQDENARSISVSSPAAVAWCALGAVSAARAGDDWNETEVVRHFLQPFAHQLGYGDPAMASNDGGREVAIRMLRMAAGQVRP